MAKKSFRKVTSAKVKIFKITNRCGYAAVCLNNLTEGSTAYQAYLRMIKALRRSSYELVRLPLGKVRRLIVSKI